MCFIDGKNLCYKYGVYGDEKSTNALNDINIKINRGEFVAVLGHNGSGKSTLAKTFNALIIPEGDLVINGLDAEKEENIWEIRKSVGMVFQNPDNQIIASVVEEDAAFGPENLGVKPEEIVKRVEFALENVGMTEYRLSEPSHLSGGQKQRIAIAGILAMMPECIVLDEPTAMLDPIGRREVMQTIEKLKREKNITVVLITHFMDEAAKAERLIVMNEGKIAEDGKPKDVFADVRKMKELRLDVPYMTEIAYELKNCGFNIKEDISECGEMAEELLKIGFKEKFVFEKEKKEKVRDEVILKTENLSYIYEENSVFEKKALDNINIEIRKGEFIGLIGHTGSGKSTLTQIMNGLIKPSSGRVLFKGRDISDDKKIRMKIGLIFQYPEYQLFEINVFDEVAFALKNMGADEEEIKERVKEALAAVDMGEEYYEKSPFGLSGGEKRRVAIASILVMQPEILILDEPTAGLDPKTRDDIMKNIVKMKNEMGMTVVMVSHSMEDIAEIADRVIVMKNGKTAYDGEKEDIFGDNEKMKNMGLDIPKCAMLAEILRNKGIDVPKEVFTVKNTIKFLKGALVK